VLHGDFGPSYRYRDRSIGEVIWPKIWVSVRVGAYAFFLTFLIGVPVGMFAALHQGTWRDSGLIGVFLFFDSIPTLVSVPTLVLVLSAKLHWLPPGGFDGLLSKSMVIPTIALTVPAIAGIARLTRTSMLGVMHEDFVRTARAKGLEERVVVLRHAARMSLLPVMTTVVPLALAGMLSGALFTEILLGIPGIGSFLYEAVRSQDYNVVLAMVVLLCTAFVIANLVVDVLLIVLDPRVRAARGDS
jgi:ABC-type dipeptide/oligopeptide/nickel transport system permease component